MLPMLKGLITRDTIAELARSERLILADESRISILEAMNSIDVQACPGSGKTTLIAAKLILLAKEWPFQHQGVCVLSHTNVAKDEIIARLNRSNNIATQRLLAYPHFIGTIQEFVNRFLALPFLRSNGVKDITVDNDEYIRQAKRLLGLNQFSWLRGTLNGLGDVEDQEGFLRDTFRLVSQREGEVNINKKPKAWQQDKNLQRAIRDLEQLKKYLDDRGFFLFRDMYTFASMALSLNNELSKSLRERFPCVLLDEMQDTQKFQDELLNVIFPRNDHSIIVQRFGDPDQAIFHGVGNEEPNESYNGKSQKDMDYVLHKSHRFGDLIADKTRLFSLNEIPLETELSVESLRERAKVHATSGKFEHTILIFNNDTLINVIDAFAQLVSHQFADAYKQSKCFSAKVVGAVGNPIDPTKIQLKIGHYCSQYDKSKTKTNFKETSIVDAIRYYRNSSLIDWAEKYKGLMDCILKLMRMAEKVDVDGRYFSSSTLKKALEYRGNWTAFRKGIYWLLNDANELDKQIWEKVRKRLIYLLDLNDISNDISVEVTDYLAFSETLSFENTATEEKCKEEASVVFLPNNILRYSYGFQIELSTIHGVKGETHDATLILETKNHIFDLETMLPYLTGKLPSNTHPNPQIPEKPNSRRSFKPNKVFMRQLYVAMSRPRHLLCLSLHSDRISNEDRDLLEEKGWTIKILESPTERSLSHQ